MIRSGFGKSAMDLFIMYTSDCLGCKFKVMKGNPGYADLRKKVLKSGSEKFGMPARNNPMICSNGTPMFLRPALRAGKCGKKGGGTSLDAIGQREPS